MREKIRLIIIMGLAAMLAVSLFIGQQTYSAKKAIEVERNGLRNENESLARKLEEIARDRRQLQEKVNALSSDLDKASQERQGMQKQYESLVKERDELVGKLRALQINNEQLRADLSNLSREKQRLGQNLEDNLTPLRDENGQLKEQLEHLKSLKSKLETELGQLKGEKSGLERKLIEIESILEQRLTSLEYANLKEQLDTIGSGGTPETQTDQPEKESVELPAIVVRPQAQAETSTWPKKSIPVKPTGAVLEVSKESKFVIVDLGLDAGTKMGDILKVYRQGAPIAAIEVIQVRQSISACDIKEEITAIEAGDIVR
ncbi:MAG: hypothetical protein Q8R31_01875 [Candidatus Omnitrophota bacterium]|nr:hypothetical protein [Candidatus Omnitrophota bacterium]